LASKAGLSDDDLKHFLSYAAQFLGNTGNFKSFGDSKFIPRVATEKIASLAGTSSQAQKLYDSIKDDLYESKSIAGMHLGYPDDGHISTYYPDSSDISKEEIELTADFLKKKQLLPENTRLRKTGSGDYEVLIASAVSEPAHHDTAETQWTLESGKKLKLVYGDCK
jgi:dipeptidyl-peptidase III